MRNSAAHRVHAARWIERNPQKRRAHHDVRNAIRRGELQRQPCHCGRPGQAHHDDYSEPLEVRWLCARHHKAFHTAAKAEDDRVAGGTAHGLHALRSPGVTASTTARQAGRLPGPAARVLPATSEGCGLKGPDISPVLPRFSSLYIASAHPPGPFAIPNAGPVSPLRNVLGEGAERDRRAFTSHPDEPCAPELSR